jgi:hypothetical protein
MFSLAKKLSLTVRGVMASAIDNLFTALKGRATYSENIADSKQVVKDIDNYELLDKASILLTPTAYSDARVHSVKTYTGDELVTNGTFDTDSDWTLGSGWSIEGGVVKGDGASFDYVAQNISGLSGKTIKITFEIKDWISGTFRVLPADRADGLDERYSGNGTYEVIYTSNVDLFRFQQQAFDGSIDNVSIIDVSSDFDFDRASSATRINSDGLVQDMQSITDPELVLNGDFEELGDDLVTNGDFATDSDWNNNVGNDWQIVNGKLILTTTSYNNINQGIGLVQNKFYKIVFTIANTTLGGVRVRLGTGTITSEFTNGTHTIYLEQTTTNDAFRFYASSSGVFDGEIDNVSVQQVDPNDRWTLGTGWSVEDGVASYGGGSNSAIIQNISLTSGNVYNIKFTVSNASGNASIFIGNGSGNVDYFGSSYTDYANGDYDLYFTMPSTQSTLAFYGESTGSNFSIDNISVKDVTFSEDVDLARINYDSNGENGHWLLEPTSTNIITYSEDLSEWGETNATTISNSSISPSGLLNADKVIASNSNSSHNIFLVPSVSASTTYTFSLYAKADEYERLYVRQGTGGNPCAAVYELSGSGSVLETYSSPLDTSINNVGNGWYRITLTNTTSATTPNFAPNIVGIPNSGYGASDAGVTFQGDGTSGIYIWGVQLEALSYATSYIPTLTGSTVTRATETLTGSGNSTLINSTEGVLYAEIAALADDSTNRLISLSNADTSQQVWLYFNTSNGLTYRVYNGSTQSTYSHSINTKTFNKIAVKYKANDFGLFVNGIKVYTDTSGSTFTENTLTKLNFDAGDGALDFYGEVKELAVFDEALENDELELLTGITNYGSFSELAQANGYTII